MKKQLNVNKEYVLHYFENKGAKSRDEIEKAFALFDSLEYTGKDAEQRYHQAYVMCRFMEPDTQDVITLLFSPARLTRVLNYEPFKNTFAKDRSKYLFTLASECAVTTRQNKILIGAAGCDYNAMLSVCDHTLDRILDIMAQRGLADTEVVRKAYAFARRAHSEVLRQSGEPYLNHPVAVAKILAEIGVESAVVAGAILHDVCEDSSYTLDDISDCCGEQVSRYVDAVTSVHKQYAGSRRSDEYSIDKKELDKKSFEKLAVAVNSDRRLIFALYIKAADRIHNLSTMDVISGEKKHNKTDETECDYLPLFYRFGLRYFVRRIDDLMWRNVNPALYEEFKSHYDELLRQNMEFADELKMILEQQMFGDINTCCKTELGIGEFRYTAEIKPYLPAEVFAMLKKKNADGDITANMVSNQMIPLCEIHVILDNYDRKGSIESFARMFIKSFFQILSPTGRVMTDFTMDIHNRFIVSVCDQFCNTIRLCFALRRDYLSYNFGSLKDIPIDVTPGRTYMGSEVIRVKLRNGKRCELPKGACVLDAAFAIHPDIGMTAKGALVNGEQISLYNLLHDGDRVEIFADTERVGGERIKYIPHVRIGWLEYVVTKDAKHLIVKTLENLYGDADPADAHKAQDEVVERVAKEIAQNIILPEGGTS